MQLYRNIIQQAFIVSWKHKYLWFFGLFAALIGSGGFEIIGQSLTSTPDFIVWLRKVADSGFFSWQALVNLKNLAISQPGSVAILATLYSIILLAVLFIGWLATVSQVAIVNSVASNLAKKPHSLQDSLNVSTKKFFPVLALNVLIKLAIWVVLIIVNLPIFSSIFYDTSITVNFSYILSFIVFVPVLVLFSFMIKYVIGYIVIKGDNFTTAFVRGWKLFRTNWIISIEMALILFFISFAIAIAAVLLGSLITIPFVFLANLASMAFGFYAYFFVIVVGIILMFVTFAFAGAFNATMQIAGWTGLFVELIGRGGESKISRLFNGLMKK